MRLNLNPDMPAVEIGRKFLHRRPDTRTVETARIVGLLQDRSGIPHVRFMVSIRRVDRTIEDGPRTLSLSTFLRHFNENE